MVETLAAPDQLITSRLRLRKPRPADALVLFDAYATDVDVVRYLTWRPHETPGDMSRYLQRCLNLWSEGAGFAYVIERVGDAESQIGMIDMRPHRHRVEFGYVLAKEHWGNGFMTESLRALVDWSLEQPGIWRASAFCDVENLASARVMQKAGMAFEGILRRYTHHPNVASQPRDCRMFAKVRD